MVGGSGPSEISSNGENWETSKTVELWAPGSDGVHCRLPDLPESMSYLSLDSMLVGNGGLGEDIGRLSPAPREPVRSSAKANGSSTEELSRAGPGTPALSSTLTL